MHSVIANNNNNLVKVAGRPKKRSKGCGPLPDARNQFNARLIRLQTAAEVDNQAALADVLGISKQAVSAAKTKGQIPVDWFITINERFDVSLDWLITGSGPMHRSEQVGEVREGQATYQSYSALMDEDVEFLQRLIDVVFSIISFGGQHPITEPDQLILIFSVFCKMFFKMPDRTELLEQFRESSIESLKMLILQAQEKSGE